MLSGSFLEAGRTKVKVLVDSFTGESSLLGLKMDTLASHGFLSEHVVAGRGGGGERGVGRDRARERKGWVSGVPSYKNTDSIGGPHP